MREGDEEEKPRAPGVAKGLARADSPDEDEPGAMPVRVNPHAREAGLGEDEDTS